MLPNRQAVPRPEPGEAEGEGETPPDTQPQQQPETDADASHGADTSAIRQTLAQLKAKAIELGCPKKLAGDWAEKAWSVKGNQVAFLETKPWAAGAAYKQQRWNEGLTGDDPLVRNGFVLALTNADIKRSVDNLVAQLEESGLDADQVERGREMGRARKAEMDAQ